MKTTLIRVLAGLSLAATALSLPGVLSPASAADDVNVRPLHLPIGEPPTIPYLYRPTDLSVVVVDPTAGTQTPVEVDPADDYLDFFELLGRSGSGFVLRIRNDRYDRIVRAQLGVPQKTLTNMDADIARLSADGRYLLRTATPSSGGIQVQVRNTTNGAVVARHTFKASTKPDPIDAGGTRVLVGGFNTPRTMIWDWKAGTIKTIASRAAHAGSLATNRLATYTKDPYAPDACTVVSTVTAPGTTLWRGCLEAVASFSPDGARFATEGISHERKDVVRRRSLRGTLLTTYRNPNKVWMEAWETNTRILLKSYPADGSDAWLVRCEVADCERATKFRND